LRDCSLALWPVFRRNAIIDFLDEEDVKHVYVFNDPKSGELVASQTAPNT
jgi:hypothetical protein